MAETAYRYIRLASGLGGQFEVLKLLSLFSHDFDVGAITTVQYDGRLRSPMKSQEDLKRLNELLANAVSSAAAAIPGDTQIGNTQLQRLQYHLTNTFSSLYFDDNPVRNEKVIKTLGNLLKRIPDPSAEPGDLPIVVPNIGDISSTTTLTEVRNRVRDWWIEAGVRNLAATQQRRAMQQHLSRQEAARLRLQHKLQQRAVRARLISTVQDSEVDKQFLITLANDWAVGWYPDGQYGTIEAIALFTDVMSSAFQDLQTGAPLVDGQFNETDVMFGLHYCLCVAAAVAQGSKPRQIAEAIIEDCLSTVRPFIIVQIGVPRHAFYLVLHISHDGDKTSLCITVCNAGYGALKDFARPEGNVEYHRCPQYGELNLRDRTEKGKAHALLRRLLECKDWSNSMSKFFGEFWSTIFIGAGLRWTQWTMQCRAPAAFDTMQQLRGNCVIFNLVQAVRVALQVQPAQTVALAGLWTRMVLVALDPRRGSTRATTYKLVVAT